MGDSLGKWTCYQEFTGSESLAIRRRDIMTAMSSTEPDDPEDWLRDRGFRVVIEEHHGWFWAHLTRLPSNRVVAGDYGRGVSPANAIKSARSRYEVEQ
jgi:hypothetical protein